MSDAAAKLAAWRARRAAGAVSPVEASRSDGLATAPVEAAPMAVAEADPEAQPVSSYARPLPEPPSAEPVATTAGGGGHRGVGGSSDGFVRPGVGGSAPGDGESGVGAPGGVGDAEPSGARPGEVVDPALLIGEPGRCRSCAAPVRWITTPAGRTMPLDVEPIEIIADADLARAGLTPPRADEWQREPILYRMAALSPERLVVPISGHRAPAGAVPEIRRTSGLRSHFVTCRDGSTWRTTK